MTINITQRRKGGAFRRSMLIATSAISAIWLSTAAGAQTTAAGAQTTDAGQQAAGTPDETVVVVTGIRKSFEDSINSKRRSANVTDVITAEDVGKSTDANVAEALQRVAGISIDRSNGEGTTVTVRGINADLNNVTVNGVTLTATGGDLNAGGGSNAVNFSQFSSDIISQIIVRKTASASQDEGSLGASIELNTFKPLGVKKNRRSFDYQWRASPTVVDKPGDSRYGIALSQKFFDNKFGVSLVASHETSTIRIDDWNIPRYYVYKAGAPVVTNGNVTRLPGGFTDADTGANVQGLYAHAPFEMSYNYNNNHTARDTIATSFEYRPSSATDIQLDVTYSNLDSNLNQQKFAIRPQPNSEGANTFYDSNSMTLVGWRRSALNYGLTAAQMAPSTVGIQNGLKNPQYIRPEGIITDTTDKNLVVGLTVKHHVGEFDFKFSAGRSETTSKDNLVIDATFQIDNALSGAPGTAFYGPNSFYADTAARSGFYTGYICQNGIASACNISVDASAVPNRDQSLGPISDSASEYSFGSFNFRDRHIDDVSENIFFDTQWHHQFGPISGLEAGIKWSSRLKDQAQTNSNFDRYNIVQLYGAPMSLFATGSAPSDWGSDLGIDRDSLSNGWPTVDPQKAVDYLASLPGGVVPKVTPALVNSRTIGVKTWGGYMMADLDFFDGRVKGDMGLRYVETSVDSTGGASVALITGPLTTQAANLTYYGSQAAAQAAMGADLQGPQLPDGSPNPAYVQIDAAPVSVSNKYKNFLPSLNLAYFLSQDKILRFAVSKTMARPPLDQLNARFNYGESPFNAQSFANGGNPLLKPFESENVDLSAEWYFDKGALLSVALFDKKLSNFTRQVSNLYFIRDYRSTLYDANGVALPPSQWSSAPSINDLIPFDANNQPANCMPNREYDMSNPVGQIAYGCDVVGFTTSVNGAGGYVRGVELAYQQNFTNLPGLWSGLGVAANYTYSDSSTDEEKDANGKVTQLATPFPQTSLHTFNATVFYEKNGTLLRLAYNNRSDYLVNANILGGYAQYRQGFSTLDFSSSFQLTEHVQLNIQGQNLTNTVTRDYAVYTGLNGNPNLPGESVKLGEAPRERTLNLYNTGPIYRVGIRATF
ncbi:MAG: TonB-dependent receptor [Asticcacaulis sp.]